MAGKTAAKVSTADGRMALLKDKLVKERAEAVKNKIEKDMRNKSEFSQAPGLTSSFRNVLLAPKAVQEDFPKLGEQRSTVAPAPARSFVQPAPAMRSVYGASVQRSQGPQGVSVQDGRSTDRWTDKVHDAAAYQVGVIFSTAMHESDDREYDESNTNQSASGFGVVYSKFRKMVIVHRSAKQVIALPIYTHGGRGLERENNRNEFVSVREVDFKDTAAPAEGHHPIIWADAEPFFKRSDLRTWHMMNDQTVIHLEGPYTHKVSRKATISGRLLPESKGRLLSLYKEAMGFGGNDEEAAPPSKVDADGFESVTRKTTSRLTANPNAAADWRSARSGIYSPPH